MRLRKAFVGLGTSDKVVVRVLGGHDKADILAIAAAYQRKYTYHLKDSIKKECSGKASTRPTSTATATST